MGEWGESIGFILICLLAFLPGSESGFSYFLELGTSKAASIPARPSFCPAASCSMQSSSVTEGRWWKGIRGLFCSFSPLSCRSVVLCFEEAGGGSAEAAAAPAGKPGWGSAGGRPEAPAQRCLNTLCLREERKRSLHAPGSHPPQGKANQTTAPRNLPSAPESLTAF